MEFDSIEKCDPMFSWNLITLKMGSNIQLTVQKTGDMEFDYIKSVIQYTIYYTVSWTHGIRLN